VRRIAGAVAQPAGAIRSDSENPPTEPGNSGPRGGLSSGCSDGPDAGGLGTLGALSDLELDPLVLFEGAEAASLDLRVVDKLVGRSVLGGY
jgi:hypothetical protein